MSHLYDVVVNKKRHVRASYLLMSFLLQNVKKLAVVRQRCSLTLLWLHWQMWHVCSWLGNVEGCSDNSTVYLNNKDVPRCPKRSWLAMIFFLIYILTTSIMLINLLIAIFRLKTTFHFLTFYITHIFERLNRTCDYTCITAGWTLPSTHRHTDTKNHEYHSRAR